MNGTCVKCGRELLVDDPDNKLSLCLNCLYKNWLERQENNDD